MRPSRPTVATSLARCALVPVAVLLLVYVPIWAGGVGPEQVTRDPVAIADLAPYAGALSLAGIMLWAVMVGACVLAALVLQRTGAPRPEVAFFAASALLLAFLALDDAYQLHENVLPYEVGVPQSVTYLVYAVAAAAWAWTFRDRLLRSDIVVLGCAGALLGASVALDVLSDTWLEDYLKFCGLCIGVAYWVASARDALLANHRAPAD